MATLDVHIDTALASTVRVQAANSAVQSGYVKLGSITVPDTLYPNSYVLFHKVRDLLYPLKIWNMQRIKIVNAA